ncbi:Netrin receptor [Dirofilaria immitis]
MPENVHWKTDDDSITIWWDPPPTVDEILVRGYTISYGIGTPNRRVIIEGANTNAFTINKLKSNTTYVFALTAYNEADGEDSEKVFFTATTEIGKGSDDQLVHLQAPTNLEVKTISSNEITIQWVDPNVDIYYDHPSESIKSMFQKRKYVIQYGEYKSLNLEKITSTVPYVLLNNLQPSTEYEIIVKVIMPNGIESAWSNREVIRTSSNVTLIKGSKLFELRFDFEKSERCFFYSDQSAPLQWEMIETNNKLKVRRAKHFASLQSRIVDGNYGQLISTPIILNDNNYCLSMWIYIRQFSKGIFTVGLLRKLKDYNYENSLYVGKLEEIPNEQWRHLLLNFINSHDQFQITFHVEKEDGNQFWLALDDITVHSGKCKPDPNAILRYNQQSAC